VVLKKCVKWVQRCSLAELKADPTSNPSIYKYFCVTVLCVVLFADECVDGTREAVWCEQGYQLWKYSAHLRGSYTLMSTCSNIASCLFTSKFPNMYRSFVLTLYMWMYLNDFVLLRLKRNGKSRTVCGNYEFLDLIRSVIYNLTRNAKFGI
jgi:hypothetical protein